MKKLFTTIAILGLTLFAGCGTSAVSYDYKETVTRYGDGWDAAVEEVSKYNIYADIDNATAITIKRYDDKDLDSKESAQAVVYFVNTKTSTWTSDGDAYDIYVSWETVEAQTNLTDGNEDFYIKTIEINYPNSTSKYYAFIGYGTTIYLTPFMSVSFQ